MWCFIQKLAITYIVVMIGIWVVITTRDSLFNHTPILLDVTSNARINMACRNGFVFAISDTGSIIQVMDDAFIPRYMTCQSKTVEPRH